MRCTSRKTDPLGVDLDYKDVSTHCVGIKGVLGDLWSCKEGKSKLEHLLYTRGDSDRSLHTVYKGSYVHLRPIEKDETLSPWEQLTVYIVYNMCFVPLRAEKEAKFFENSLNVSPNLPWESWRETEDDAPTYNPQTQKFSFTSLSSITSVSSSSTPWVHTDRGVWPLLFEPGESYWVPEGFDTCDTCT